MIYFDIYKEGHHLLSVGPFLATPEAVEAVSIFKHDFDCTVSVLVTLEEAKTALLDLSGDEQ